MTGDKIDKENLAFGDLSDIEMANMVRMLTRADLLHEAVCVGARDRIMYLSQQLKISDSNIELLVNENKETCSTLDKLIVELRDENRKLENKIYDLEGELERVSYGEDF